jgi:hypothetical protein
MTIAPEEVRSPDTARQERPRLESLIARGVLGELGRPRDLHTVQVRRVFGGKFRVNVFVRADASTFRIAHSFFLEADEAGKVANCSPPLVRLY